MLMLSLCIFVVNAKKHIINLYKMSEKKSRYIVDSTLFDCYISNTA